MNYVNMYLVTLSNELRECVSSYMWKAIVCIESEDLGKVEHEAE